MPQADKLSAIYCALLSIAEGGGSITFPLSPAQGGTGVANAAGETITINGGFALAMTLTGATGLTLPTTGTLAVTGIVGFDSVCNEGVAIASAATVNLDAATGNFVHITGVTQINALTLAQGHQRILVFDGVLVLSQNASIVGPGGVSITTAAGDVAWVIGEGAAVTRIVCYQRKDGTALVASNPFNQTLDTGSSVVFDQLTTVTSATLQGQTGISGTLKGSDGFNSSTAGLVFTADGLGGGKWSQIIIVDNVGSTIDVAAGIVFDVDNNFQLKNTNGAPTILDTGTFAAPAATTAIGVPTVVYGNPAVALLADPADWMQVTKNGVPFICPLYTP